MSSELNHKIRDRFDELIEDLETLIAELDEYDYEHYLRFTEWVVKTSGLLKMVFGDSKEGEKYISIVERNHGPRAYILRAGGKPSEKILSSSMQSTLATLKGIRNNYVNGYYVSIEDQIIANVAADYMEQAEALLGEGIQGQYSHLPAAVLCGAVLEDALRRLCQKQKPPIDIVKSNGQKKTMEPLIQDLQKVQVFNKLVVDQLRTWAKIRNYAAHGEYNEFTREQVELMLLGVNGFLANHL